MDSKNSNAIKKGILRDILKWMLYCTYKNVSLFFDLRKNDYSPLFRFTPHGAHLDTPFIIFGSEIVKLSKWSYFENISRHLKSYWEPILVFENGNFKIGKKSVLDQWVILTWQALNHFWDISTAKELKPTKTRNKWFQDISLANNNHISLCILWWYS